MNIIKKNQFIILLTIMSLFSITSLSTTLCYKVKLDNYNKNNINEKTYIENDEYGNKPMEYFKNAEWKQITDKEGKYNTANKGGWADSAFHDIAIVFDKNPYIIAIYSNTGNNYNDYTYLFNKTSELVGNLHTEYWKQKITDCNKIEQY